MASSVSGVLGDRADPLSIERTETPKTRQIRFRRVRNHRWVATDRPIRLGCLPLSNSPPAGGEHRRSGQARRSHQTIGATWWAMDAAWGHHRTTGSGAIRGGADGVRCPSTIPSSRTVDDASAERVQASPMDPPAHGESHSDGCAGVGGRHHRRVGADTRHAKAVDAGPPLPRAGTRVRAKDQAWQGVTDLRSMPIRAGTRFAVFTALRNA
jgi:hypothetical protein